MTTVELLRKLAKSDYYQSIFALSKDMYGVQVFANSNDFSDIQITFIKYLSFYSVIFTDISLGEVDESILSNEIYEDSYIMYKNHKDKKVIKKHLKKDDTPIVGATTKWLFKKPKRE